MPKLRHHFAFLPIAMTGGGGQVFFEPHMSSPEPHPAHVIAMAAVLEPARHVCTHASKTNHSKLHAITSLS
jgi:hypothetical protein